MKNVLTSIFGIISLTGCSIHPQTEDFSREYLPDIVYKIRCETRQAIIDIIPTDPSDPWSYLQGSGVNFDFLFTLTERDDATTLGGVTFPVTYGTFRIGWDAGLKKERVTTLAVNTTDSFKKLIALEDCDFSTRKNIKYPITGNIGLHETVTNFASLARQNTGLFKEFSDQIKFQTDVFASVNPSVRLVPQIGRLITAEGTLKGQRVDVHQVKLSFLPAEHPDATTYRLAKEEKARKLRLSELEAEKRIPERVMIVAPDGKPIDPRKPASPVKPGSDLEIQGFPPAADAPERLESARKKAKKSKAPSAPLPKLDSSSDIERRTYDNFRDNEARRLDQQLLEELRRR